MNLYPILALFSLAFGLLLGIGVTKKYKKNHQVKKIGCLGPYITIITIAISFIAIPLTFVIPATFAPLLSGERMRVPIVDQTWHYSTSEDSDGNDRTVKMYTPVVEIVLQNDKAMQRELDYSSGSEADIGTYVSIYYDEKNDEIVSLGMVSVLVKIVGFTVCLFMLALLWYGANYALGISRKRPKALIGRLLLHFIMPMMMLGFIVGMFGYLYNTWFLGNNPDDHPVGIAVMVVFFIGCMTFVIWTYYNALMGRNGKEKLKNRMERKAKVFKNRKQKIFNP